MDEAISFIYNFIFYFAIIFLLVGFILNRYFLFSKGFKLIRKDKYWDAIKELSLDEKKEKSEWRINYGIGFCYFMMGYIENSISFFEKALFNNPKNIHVLFFLTILYLEIEDKKNKAAEIFNSALEINKKRFFLLRYRKFLFWEIAGWIELSKNNLENARKYYQYAIPRWRKNLRKNKIRHINYFSPVFYRIGCYYLKSKEEKKSVSFFKNAIKAAPESIFANKSRNELRKMGVQIKK